MCRHLWQFPFWACDQVLCLQVGSNYSAKSPHCDIGIDTMTQNNLLRLFPLSMITYLDMTYLYCGPSY